MGKNKILVVDDEPVIRMMVSSRLKAAGYEVRLAENGEQCLKMVAEDKPDLIMLDIMMPVMDGTAAAGILKRSAETKLIPIIFLTALATMAKDKMIFNNDEEMQKTIAFLPKPFKGEELLGLVKKLLPES